MVNNLTLILCWSAAEAGRYLELFKSYEHASPSSIRAQEKTSRIDRITEFVTTPRAINKTDAVTLVSEFGTMRRAVNARPEEVGMLAGWGERKVLRWCGAVREPFRVRRAAAVRIAGLERGESTREEGGATPATGTGEGAKRPPMPIGRNPSRQSTHGEGESSAGTPATPAQGERPKSSSNVRTWEPDQDDEDAMLLAAAEEEDARPNSGGMVEQAMGHKTADGGVSEGVAAALAKLRKE